MSKEIIGKPFIVRGNIAGVHAGIVESFEPQAQTVILTGSRRLWRIYTRDKSGSISDVAANGLAPNKEHQIGAKLLRTVIVNPQGLEVSEMTPEAYQSVLNWE